MHQEIDPIWYNNIGSPPCNAMTIVIRCSDTVDREIFAHKTIRLLKFNFRVILFSSPRHTGSVVSFLLFNVEKYSCF